MVSYPSIISDNLNKWLDYLESKSSSTWKIRNWLCRKSDWIWDHAPSFKEHWLSITSGSSKNGLLHEERRVKSQLWQLGGHSKDPVLQYPKEVTRAVPTALTRVRGESGAPGKTELIRDVPGQAGKLSQQVRIRPSDGNQDQPLQWSPASLWWEG